MKKPIALLLCMGIATMLLTGCQGDSAQALSSFVAEAAESTPEPIKSEPLSSTTDTSVFTDVPSTHWAYESIESAFAKGILNGTGNGKFEPEAVLTRAQVAQIAYNAYGGNGLTKEALEVQDVPGDVWYTEAVTWLLQYNLAELNEGKFYPNDPAPRWFIADLLYKLSMGMDVKLLEENDAAAFPDMTGEYAEYEKAVTALQKAGVISGFPDGTFGPEQTLTRCQMAKLIDLFTDIPGLTPGTKLPMPEPDPEPTAVPGEPETLKPTETSTTEPPATTTPPETTPTEPPVTTTPSETNGLMTPEEFFTTLESYAKSYGFSMEEPITQTVPSGQVSDIDLSNGSYLIRVNYAYNTEMTNEIFAYYVFDSNLTQIEGGDSFLHSIEKIKPILEKYSN